MQYNLQLFGRPKLLGRDGHQIAVPPVIWRVLAVVASHPLGVVSRATVLKSVWGDAKRSTLRKILWNVREIERASNIKILEHDLQSVSLSEELYCDAQDLLSKAPREPLSRIYRGEYVERVFSTMPAWTNWIGTERERLRGIYIAKATAMLANSNLLRSELVQEARHLLKIDPNAEAALRTEMVTDAIGGSDADVRRKYGGLEVRLRTLGQQPSDDTRNLFVRLVGGADVNEVSRGSDPGVPSICIIPPSKPLLTPASQLAQSLVADVTIGLCRNSLFKVVAPHTAAQIQDPLKLADLGVSYVVTIETIGHAVGGEHVVSTLMFLPESRVLWSDRIEAIERYSVDTYNLLTAGVLRSVMRHVDQATINAYSLKTEPSSYVDFLLGQSSLTSLDLRDIRRGRQHLRRAVDRSPSFAPAMSALARSYQLEWLLTARGDNEMLARSHHYAREAVAADPYEARGHRELGFYSLYCKQFDLSIQHYETAERLNPHYADILSECADALVHDGQPQAALVKIDKAIVLNPLCQDSYFWVKGSAHYFLEQYQDAIDTLSRMKDRSPVYRLLAAVYAQAGDKEQASRCRIKAMELHPDMSLDTWMDIVPFRDPRQIQHYHEGLRLAGFN